MNNPEKKTSHQLYFFLFRKDEITKLQRIEATTESSIIKNERRRIPENVVIVLPQPEMFINQLIICETKGDREAHIKRI